MKKTIIKTVIFTLLICILYDKIYGVFIFNYNYHPELRIKSCSKEEKKIGKEIEREFQKIVDYSGKKADAVLAKEMGPLNDFYYFTDSYVVNQEVKIKFITSEIQNDKGKVWYDIKIKRYEKKDDGGIEKWNEKGIIVCYIRKDEGKWIVTMYGWVEDE